MTELQSHCFVLHGGTNLVLYCNRLQVSLKLILHFSVCSALWFDLELRTKNMERRE